MKKHFWTRLISAVVTMAMAFSILVMPASAASANWAFGDEPIVEDLVYGACWFTDLAWEYMMGEKLTLDEFKAEYGVSSYAYLTSGIPDDAYVGLSKSLDTSVYWYAKEAILLMASYEEPVSLDWDTGKLSFANGEYIYPIGYNSGNAGSSSSVGVSANADGTTVLVAAGTAVAAITGLYLYTHPQLVQDVKDFFKTLYANIRG